MRITICTVFAALALVAGSAWAQNWTSAPGGVGGRITTLKPGMIAYYDFTGSTDSGLITIEGGRAVLCFDPDVTTTGTATSTVYWRGPCVTNGVGTSTCEIQRVDQDGDGIVDILPLNGDDVAGRRCIWGITGQGFCEVDTASGGETSRCLLMGY